MVRLLRNQRFDVAPDKARVAQTATQLRFKRSDWEQILRAARIPPSARCEAWQYEGGGIGQPPCGVGTDCFGDFESDNAGQFGVPRTGRRES